MIQPSHLRRTRAEMLDIGLFYDSNGLATATSSLRCTVEFDGCIFVDRVLKESHELLLHIVSSEKRVFEIVELFVIISTFCFGDGYQGNGCFLLNEV